MKKATEEKRLQKKPKRTGHVSRGDWRAAARWDAWRAVICRKKKWPTDASTRDTWWTLIGKKQHVGPTRRRNAELPNERVKETHLGSGRCAPSARVQGDRRGPRESKLNTKSTCGGMHWRGLDGSARLGRLAGVLGFLVGWIRFFLGSTFGFCLVN